MLLNLILNDCTKNKKLIKIIPNLGKNVIIYIIYIIKTFYKKSK